MKVAIVGKAPSSWALAPYKDPTWQIWALNDLPCDSQIERWDRHFDIHNLDIHRRQADYAKYWEWMQKTDAERPGSLTIREPAIELPNATIYPLDAVLEKFGTYFTNSISYMIAAALLEGATELGLYGVDMAQHGIGVKSEYAQQRPSCEYLVGFARGMGVPVYVPPQSDLMKVRRLYGVTDPGDFEGKILTRKSELQQRQAHAKKCVDEANQHANRALGALEIIKDLAACTNGEVEPLLTERATKYNQALSEWAAKRTEAQSHYDMFYGALDDLEYMQQWA